MKAWQDDAKLVQAFRELAEAVASLMDDAHVGRTPRNLLEASPEAAFLDASVQRLAGAFSKEWLRAQYGDVKRHLLSAESTRSSESAHIRQRWLKRFGFSDRGIPEGQQIKNHHAYALLQIRASDPLNWSNPAHGILHAATQIAFGTQLKGGGNDDERAFTTGFLTELARNVELVLRRLDDRGLRLPPGLHLDLGVVDMQGKRDELDSDLALVVGVRINGKPMYRVCVLQAKWRPGFGGRIGERDGAQLEGILSTGMGYYLFYPNPNPKMSDPFRFASVLPARRRLHLGFSLSGSSDSRLVKEPVDEQAHADGRAMGSDCGVSSGPCGHARA